MPVYSFQLGKQFVTAGSARRVTLCTVATGETWVLRDLAIFFFSASSHLELEVDGGTFQSWDSTAANTSQHWTGRLVLPSTSVLSVYVDTHAVNVYASGYHLVP